MTPVLLQFIENRNERLAHRLFGPSRQITAQKSSCDRFHRGFDSLMLKPKIDNPAELTTGAPNGWDRRYSSAHLSSPTMLLRLITPKRGLRF
jgi:hypothetical protein